jgi:hypothetical protein
MTEPVPASLDLNQASEVTPARAPVGAPLSGKERAGVNLTWGVLGIVAVYLVVVLVFLWRRESALEISLPSSGGAVAADTLRFRLMAAERTAFRAFWLDMVQMVLVNVLLPVLTALLGYVFGTHARAATQDS